MTIEAPDFVSDVGQTTDDAFLGGMLNLLQPANGYRAGLDAVLLAATVTAPVTGTTLQVLDVGSGVGTVGLSAAVRLPELKVTLVERDLEYAALADKNIARNNLTSRCRVLCEDVAGDANELSARGLAPETFDHVLANPPFHDVGRGTPAPNRLKTDAHAMDEDGLEAWARFMVRVAKPSGLVTIIHKTQALPRLLKVFAGRFGGLTVLPIVSHRGGVSRRVLVRGQKGSRAPFQLLSPFHVHSNVSATPEAAGDGAKFTEDASAILRRGAALDSLRRPD